MASDPRIKAGLLFGRFMAVGLLNTGFGYVVFAGLILLGLWPGAALVGSSVAGVAFNFQTSRHLVFRSSGRAVRFVVMYCVVLTLNWLALRMLHDAGMSALLAQAILVIPIAAVSFLGQKAFVFSSVAERA